MPAPPSAAPSIVLCTLNARYIHASLGLRYLLANMDRHGGPGLRQRTVLREFTLAPAPQAIVDELLATLGPVNGEGPQIVGFGVYIWNVRQTSEVVRLLKSQRPDIRIVLGGPEVSHEVAQQDIVQRADFVITGWGDVSFPRLCHALWHGPAPRLKIIAGEQAALSQIASPYGEYSDTDLAHRLLYVEASRGCPFKCEFCLSSLDKTAWAFDLDDFLLEMQGLYQRGARNFKFVDRTFNLKIDTSVRILQFFLERLPVADASGATEPLLLHFEVVPDQLPERLKAMIARFPCGVLQLELGVQSFNVEVQQRISRRQDNARSEANLRWLVQASRAHLHTDLIFGLPGETLASFAAGFDRLHALGPHEIQLGILKRLRGTPIARHSAGFGMVYDPCPPYTVQQTDAVDAVTVQRFVRLARYWDLVANSGRFKQTLPALLGARAAPDAGPDSGSPFFAFLAFSDWLWARSGLTNGLSPEQLVDWLFDYLTTQRAMAAPAVRQALLADYAASGARSCPAVLRGWLARPASPAKRDAARFGQRQHLHGAAASG